MNIRPAAPADAAAIAGIWNPIIALTATTFTTEEKTVPGLKSMIEGSPCFLVSETARGIRGFGCYDAFRPGPGYDRTREVTIYLAPEARELGYGSRLLKALEEHASAAGIATMVAGISGENSDAAGFFQRVGYRREGHLKGVGYKFDRWMDLILMTKRLI